jgi:hypothetical protein
MHPIARLGQVSADLHSGFRHRVVGVQTDMLVFISWIAAHAEARCNIAFGGLCGEPRPRVTPDREIMLSRLPVLQSWA